MSESIEAVNTVIEGVQDCNEFLDTEIENPFPQLDSTALYGLAGDIVKMIEPHSEADPVALLIQTLVAFGSVVGRGPHALVESDEHHMNLYAVLVGETSKGRKGTAWGHIRRLFSEVDTTWNERVQAGLSSGEGLIWAVRDPIYKTEAVREKGKPTGEIQEVLTDQGINDKRLLVIEPEFASTLRVLGRNGNILSAVIRQSWDTGDLRVLTKNSPAKATGAHVSIIGHITDPELKRYLDTTEAGNGFGNRYLWICVRRSKCLPEGGNMEEVDVSPILKRLSDSIRKAREIGRIVRDERARVIWANVYPELSEGQPGLCGAVISRAEAQVLRLSNLHALINGESQVQEQHMNAALALWQYCEDSARFIFGDNVGDRVADEILSVLRRTPEGLTRTEIYRDVFKNNRKSPQIQRALDDLEKQGLVHSQTERGQDGRPGERWFSSKIEVRNKRDLRINSPENGLNTLNTYNTYYREDS